jgi:hypothetical protein
MVVKKVRKMDEEKVGVSMREIGSENGIEKWRKSVDWCDKGVEVVGG